MSLYFPARSSDAFRWAATCRRAAVGIDPPGDILVHHQRKIGLRGLQFLRDFAHQDGVGGEGYLFCIFRRGGLYLRRKAIALLERDNLQRVDAREQAVKLIGEHGVVFQVHAAGEHGVNGEVEIKARSIKTVGVVVVDAGLVAGLNAVDEVLHLLGVFAVAVLSDGHLPGIAEQRRFYAQRIR